MITLDLILDFTEANSAGLGQARAEHIKCSSGMIPMSTPNALTAAAPSTRCKIVSE